MDKETFRDEDEINQLEALRQNYLIFKELELKEISYEYKNFKKIMLDFIKTNINLFKEDIYEDEEGNISNTIEITNDECNFYY